MLEKINQLSAEIGSLKITSSSELEEYRIKYLAKKGIITALFDEFRNVPAESKRRSRPEA